MTTNDIALNAAVGNGVTMSSLEIGALTGKAHRNVRADIKKMLVSLGLRCADFSAHLPDAYGRNQPVFKLAKRECFILVSGYSVELRARIIDRWMELEAATLPSSVPANLPPEVLEMIRRDDGISRMLAHKVTEQGKALAVMAEALNALAAVVQPSSPGMVIRYGKTAGEVLSAAGFIDPPKNLAKWFSNRLVDAGCQVEGRKQTGLSYSRLFDPDKAEAYLKNGGKAAVEMKIAERRGQGALALRGGALTTRELLREADGLPDGRAIVQTPGFIHFIDLGAYELDGSTEAAVIGADGFVRIDKPTLYDGHKFMGARSGMAAGKRFNMQEGVVILGRVVESRAIRARPVLAIDNAGV